MVSRLVTPPAAEPLSLAEAKAHLRLEVSEDDVQVAALIKAARQWAEGYLWRRIVTQTWELLLDGFPARGNFELPEGHLSGLIPVSFVKYLPVSGPLQTLATSAYLVDSASVPGRILLPFGGVWPTTLCQWDSVQAQYTVGWAVSDVPEDVKHGLLLVVSQLYEHRTPEVTGAIVSQVRFAVEALLAPHRLAGF